MQRLYWKIKNISVTRKNSWFSVTILSVIILRKWIFPKWFFFKIWANQSFKIDALMLNQIQLDVVKLTATFLVPIFLLFSHIFSLCLTVYLPKYFNHTELPNLLVQNQGWTNQFGPQIARIRPSYARKRLTQWDIL